MSVFPYIFLSQLLIFSDPEEIFQQRKEQRMSLPRKKMLNGKMPERKSRIQYSNFYSLFIEEFGKNSRLGPIDAFPDLGNMEKIDKINISWDQDRFVQQHTASKSCPIR